MSPVCFSFFFFNLGMDLLPVCPLFLTPTFWKKFPILGHALALFQMGSFLQDPCFCPLKSQSRNYIPAPEGWKVRRRFWPLVTLGRARFVCRVWVPKHEWGGAHRLGATADITPPLLFCSSPLICGWATKRCRAPPLIQNDLFLLCQRWFMFPRSCSYFMLCLNNIFISSKLYLRRKISWLFMLFLPVIK